MISALYRFFAYFTKALGTCCGWLTLLLVLVTVCDVVLRFGFSAGSIGVQELEWHLFGAIILLGAAYTLRRDEHVRVDIFYGRLGVRGKAFIDLLGTLFFLVPFCAVALYVSIPFVERSFALAEHSENPGGLPFRWIEKGLIPLCFLLLLLEGLQLILRSVAALYYGPAYVSWAQSKKIEM